MKNPFDHLYRDSDIEIQTDGFGTSLNPNLLPSPYLLLLICPALTCPSPLPSSLHIFYSDRSVTMTHDLSQQTLDAS